ncbi:MAG TPA: hypothetical protein VHL58_14745 [Thermoanaerobaculia bacterium]|nr:hypothetical protein [Thermoanaerobaculia bacterium]
MRISYLLQLDSGASFYREGVFCHRSGYRPHAVRPYAASPDPAFIGLWVLP